MQNWCKKLGADFVVNHYDLKNELDKIGHSQVDYILEFVNLKGYWEMMADIIKPQGHIVSITESNEPLNLNIFKISITLFVSFILVLYNVKYRNLAYENV